ncbi:MAG TPA: tripartite tricarboxylate transporter substrate binding protein [Bordetella sp.]|nr:tripartite tricarboxylate transporter substrate binding protein [Bordetella sp.]
MNHEYARRARSTALWLGALLLAAMGCAQAQDYPARPLKLIVPNAPSGSTDLVARVIADKLAGELGQPVVVENLAGAMGAIGLQALARAPADGYTLGLGTIGTIAINPVVNSGLAWDPMKDFAPVGMIGSTPFGVIVNPSLPVDSIQALIELAKQKPGKLNYATGGVGGSQHVATELLMQMSGIKMVHVPYKGSGPAQVDLMGGHIDLMIEPVVSAAEHVKAGKVKLLALTGAARSPEFPDVRLVADTLPGYDVSAWFALYAPAGTPDSAIALLNRDLQRVLRMPDVVRVLTGAGFAITPSTPAELQDFHGSEVSKWRKVVKAAGITAD